MNTAGGTDRSPDAGGNGMESKTKTKAQSSKRDQQNNGDGEFESIRSSPSPRDVRGRSLLTLVVVFFLSHNK